MPTIKAETCYPCLLSLHHTFIAPLSHGNPLHAGCVRAYLLPSEALSYVADLTMPLHLKEPVRGMRCAAFWKPGLELLEGSGARRGGEPTFPHAPTSHAQPST